jgi:lipopolysaccharide export system permease protein
VPHTAAQGYRLRAAAQQHLAADDLTAGRFHTLRDGRWLLYAQRAGARPGQLDDVFVHVQQAGPSQVLVARHALLREAQPGADRYLVLQDGYRYDGQPGATGYRVLHYAEYAVRLRAPRPASDEQKWDAVSSGALWPDDTPVARAEWHTRLSRPLSVLVLALIAVPLARYRPATGQFYPLWLGVPVFALYFNLLATAQLWLARQVLPGWLGLWWVHLALLAALLLSLLLRRPRRRIAV